MNYTVVFIDSGIGGVPYCTCFFKSYIKGAPLQKSVRLIYIADNKNFPYGPKTKNELIHILTTLCKEIIEKFAPRIIVLACNTASVSALAFLRSRFKGVFFVGTVPAIKPAILGGTKKSIAVLGTERTMEEPYIARLAAELEIETGSACTIYNIAAPDLVDFVENKYLFATREEKDKIVCKYTDKTRLTGSDSLVLGCTHFLFLRDEFINAASPDIHIYDSLEGVRKRIADVLEEIGERNEDIGTRNEERGMRDEGRNLLLTTRREEDDSRFQKWRTLAALFNASYKDMECGDL